MPSYYISGVVVLLIAASFSLPSCSDRAHSANSNTPIDKSAPIVFDTLKKGVIDSLAQRINDIINARGLKSKKIPYPVYFSSDSIGYLLTEDHHARISMNTHPDSNIVWPYFWVYNGDLILMRLRTYNREVPGRNASETVVYFDKGKIVYCNERRKELQEGEIPGAVQNEPLVKSSRSYGELEQLSQKYWSEVLNEMKKQNVLPDWLKP